MPECSASSTPYWISGLSTSGSISFGWALVAGRNRVPSPAAGKTAFRTLEIINLIVKAWWRSLLARAELQQENRDGPDWGLVELAQGCRTVGHFYPHSEQRVRCGQKIPCNAIERQLKTVWGPARSGDFSAM